MPSLVIKKMQEALHHKGKYIFHQGGSSNKKPIRFHISAFCLLIFYSAFTEIFFVSFIAFAVLGRMTVRTPFLNAAFTVAGSSSEGRGMVRLKEP